MTTQDEKIDVVIFGSRVSVNTDAPEEIKKFAEILNSELSELSSMNPGTKPNLILILQCLQMFAKMSKLENDLADLIKERETLDKILKGFLLSID